MPWIIENWYSYIASVALFTAYMSYIDCTSTGRLCRGALCVRSSHLTVCSTDQHITHPVCVLILHTARMIRTLTLRTVVRCDVGASPTGMALRTIPEPNSYKFGNTPLVLDYMELKWSCTIPKWPSRYPLDCDINEGFYTYGSECPKERSSADQTQERSPTRACYLLR